MDVNLVGVLVGAALTVAGMVVNGYLERKRQRISLDHDKEQRHRERTLATKREVFLSVAKLMGQRKQAIFECLRFEGNSSRAMDLLSAGLLGIDQLLMVAAPQTLEAFFAAEDTVREPLEKLFKLSAEADQLEKAVGDNPSPEDQRRIAVARRGVVDAGTLAMEKAVETMSDVNLAMRTELGLSIDEAAYRKMISGRLQIGEEIRQNFKRLMSGDER